MTVVEGTSRAQIERILRSKPFRASQILRRLLSFLAEKSFSGEADQLKEYSIGLDALGKPPTYDPRHDASVRLQIGRLRQKLAEYYGSEGLHDPVIVDIPKGHFKLICAPRASEVAGQPVAIEVHSGRQGWRLGTLLLTGMLAASLVWGGYVTLRLRDLAAVAVASAGWTPEVKKLWGPFINPTRPLVLAFADPMFVRFPGQGDGDDAEMRVVGADQWAAVENSPIVRALRKGLGNPEIEPRFSYVSRADLMSAFLLGRLLGARQTSLSVARLSQITWRDLSNDNIVMTGPQRVLDEKLLGLPLKPELVVVPTGIRNLHPRSGEPETFLDETPATFDGEIFALVSNLPGPVGITRVRSFASNRFWGSGGAIQAFTDPTFVHKLVAKMQGRSGTMPDYYQVVVKVKYRDGVTTDVSYVMHREIRTSGSFVEHK